MANTELSNRKPLKGGNYWQKALNFPSFRETARKGGLTIDNKPVISLMDVISSDLPFFLYDVVGGKNKRLDMFGLGKTGSIGYSGKDWNVNLKWKGRKPGHGGLRLGGKDYDVNVKLTKEF
tara:strand:- start:1090 stop:1452 length:363 start_codon:yes stop_codon:yes gene_type:complete